MKHLVKYFLALMIATPTIFAQNMEIIPMLGLSSTSYQLVEPEIGDNWQPIAGVSPVIGALLSFQASPMLAIEGGLMYGPRGYGFRYDDGINSGDIIDYYQELEIPLMVRIFLSKNLNLGLGGYYSKFTGQVIREFSGDFANVFANTTGTYEDYGMEDSNYGLLFVAGFVVPLQTSKLTLDLHYRSGLKNTSIPDNQFPDAESYISNLELYLGFRFPIGEPSSPDGDGDDFSVEPVEEDGAI